jgi:hypothetical protein
LGLREAASMFQLRTAFAALVLIVGFGSTSRAQMFNPGAATFGMNGFQSGLSGVPMGFGGQIGAGVGGVGLMVRPALPYGYGYGYGVPYYPSYPYVVPVPQTYNAMGALMNSIESSAASRDSWRRRPRPW